VPSVVHAPKQGEPDRWVVRVFVGRDPRGRPIQRTRVLHGSKRAVTRAAAELERTIRGSGSPRAVPAQATTATLADLFREWQAWNIDLGKWTALTARDHASRSKLLIRELRDVRLTSLDRKLVEDLVRRWRREGLSDSAVRSRVSTLRAACRWGVDEGWMTAVPFSAGRVGATKVPRRTKAPTIDEVRAVIAAARAAGDERVAMALRLVLVTGMRAAEVAGLRWDGLEAITGRLDIAGQADQLRRGYRLGTKYRDGQGRIITLDPATVAEMVAYLATLEVPGPYVLAGDGEELPPDVRWLTRRWMKYAAAAGVPAGRKDGYVLHDLRHAAATHALDAGIPVTAVAARLGQSPAVTLAVYAQAVKGAERNAGDALAARLDRPAEAADE
jgi:integrase